MQKIRHEIEKNALGRAEVLRCRPEFLLRDEHGQPDQLRADAGEHRLSVRQKHQLRGKRGAHRKTRM